MIGKDKEYNFYFYGNPAGLGNRYEELARLSKFAVSKNIKIKITGITLLNLDIQIILMLQTLKLNK